MASTGQKERPAGVLAGPDCFGRLFQRGDTDIGETCNL